MPVPSARLSGMVRRGFDHLAGGEGDVVPGVAREQRADHGDADGREQREAGERLDRDDLARRCRPARTRSQKSPSWRRSPAGFRPSARPRRMSPSTAAVLAMVKMFCTSLPPWNAAQLTAVSTTMLAMATSCAAVTWTARRSTHDLVLAGGGERARP